MNKLNYDAANYILDLADYNTTIKNYFTQHVLPQVDKTAFFLVNPECSWCYLRECLIKAQKKFVKNGRHTQFVECHFCPGLKGGLRLVSAHSATQQWRYSYLVLTELGYDTWLEAVHSPPKCNLSSMNTTGMRCAILAAFYNRWNEDLHPRAEKLVRKLVNSGVCMNIAERTRLRPGLFNY